MFYKNYHDWMVIDFIIMIIKISFEKKVARKAVDSSYVVRL